VAHHAKIGFDENELLTKVCKRADERDMEVAVDGTTAEEGHLEEWRRNGSYPTFQWSDWRKNPRFASY
jgi:hypothetical protein